jgi:hypothetical protein
VKYVSHRRHGHDYVVAVDVAHGWPRKTTERREYLGSCTVWHLLPDCKRASTGDECALSDIWTKIKYDEKTTIG